QILKATKKLVLTKHINVSGIDYGAWVEHVDARTPELLNSEIREFEEGVRQLLRELKTSHTVFYHSVPKELLAQHTINARLRDVALNGERKWIFLNVFEAGPAHLAGIKPGDILEAVDGKHLAPPTTPYFGVGQNHKVRIRNLSSRSDKEITIAV